MKVWVLTGTDIEGVRVLSGDLTPEQVVEHGIAPYDEEDITMSENSIVVGDYWVDATRMEVEE